MLITTSERNTPRRGSWVWVQTQDVSNSVGTWVSWDHAMSREDNHRAAVVALLTKLHERSGSEFEAMLIASPDEDERAFFAKSIFAHPEFDVQLRHNAPVPA